MTDISNAEQVSRDVPFYLLESTYLIIGVCDISADASVAPTVGRCRGIREVLVLLGLTSSGAVHVESTR